MGVHARIERFYELLPAWVRHSLTSLLSLTTMGLGIAMVCVWFMGLFPALVGTMFGGYQQEIAAQHPTLVQISTIAGALYFWVSWSFYVVGAVLIPVGWAFQLGALRWPWLHWPSRASALLALGLFAVPFGLIAVQWSIILWLT